jgi:hypothetical protein
MQVTAKLAALYVQTLQQRKTMGDVLPLAHEAVRTWLSKAATAVKASPESHAAAAVRQQLQESQLLQHLGPAMDAAAAQLTAAVGALEAATIGSSSRHDGSSSSSSSSNHASSSTEQISVQQLNFNVTGETFHSSSLLRLFMVASRALSTTGSFNIAAALPAAPAVVRLMLTVYQLHSMRQELLLSHADDALEGACVLTLEFAWGITKLLRVLQACPTTASELLLSHELLSCLAIMLVVVVVGLDTSTDGKGAQPLRRQQQQQQQGGRSSSSGSDGGGGVNHGVQLDSLTPLSCSLFDILGVTKETVLQAASLAHSWGSTNMSNFETLLAGYKSALNHQADVLMCCGMLVITWCGVLRSRTVK